MTIKETFKSYYLPWLISMGIMLGLMYVSGLIDEEKRKRMTSPEVLTVFFCAITGLTLFCGGLYHYFEVVYKSKRRIKLFNKIKKLNLTDLGLTLNEGELNFRGKYLNYSLTLTTETTFGGGEFVITNAFILIDENKKEVFIKLAEKYELNADNEVFWLTCKTNMKFGRCPKEDRLKKDIREFVDKLRFERIEPSSMID